MTFTFVADPVAIEAAAGAYIEVGIGAASGAFGLTVGIAIDGTAVALTGAEAAEVARELLRAAAEPVRPAAGRLPTGEVYIEVDEARTVVLDDGAAMELHEALGHAIGAPHPP